MEYTDPYCFSWQIIVNEILLGVTRSRLWVLFHIVCFTTSTLLIGKKVKTYSLGLRTRFGSFCENLGNRSIGFALERWMGALQRFPTER